MRPGKATLELVMLLRPLMGRVLLRRIAPRVATLVVLAMVAGFLALLTVGVLFYAGYLALMKYAALTQLQALMAVAGITLALILSCLLGVKLQLKRLRPNLFAPIEQVAETVDAFMEGFKRPNG